MNVVRAAQRQAGGKHREKAQRVRRQRNAVAQPNQP